jgi:gas vesicle structural protein
MGADADYMVLGGEGDNDEVSLLEILDNVLNSGVVIHGSIVISLAGVDLVYLGLNVILTSVETALRNLDAHGSPAVLARR